MASEGGEVGAEEMAEVQGNRTPPGRSSRPTLVLKTRRVTRPDAPPKAALAAARVAGFACYLSGSTPHSGLVPNETYLLPLLRQCGNSGLILAQSLLDLQPTAHILWTSLEGSRFGLGYFALRSNTEK